MNTREKLETIAGQRILILDGAMGTMVQRHKLNEEDYRGARFARHEYKLKGCNDVLCLTKPEIITGIHEQYLKAGADIIETCSFNANAVSLADYGLSAYAYEISRAAAELARRSADAFSTPETPRFTAGVLGPMTKSAGISPDMEDPGKRAITWDELEAAYYDNARGLLDGGADILLIETIFDTLNAKAAGAAILRLLAERGGTESGLDVPIIASAAISDAAGRLLAGQTIEAFTVSIQHLKPWAVGLNCSLGADTLKKSVQALSRAAPCRVSSHPNAGLPDENGNYTETPEKMAQSLQEYVDEELVNILGGCCGSTPEHIAAIAKMTRQRIAAGKKPRPLPAKQHKTWVSGLEPLCIERKKLTLVGESGNAAGSKRFLELIKAEKYEEGLRLVRKNIKEGAKIVDVCMDDGLIDGEKAMVRFVNLALSDPEIAKVPFFIDSSRFSIIEAGLKCIGGKSIANSISLKEGEREFLRKARRLRILGAAAVVMLFDEHGQAVDYERRIEIASRSYKLLVEADFPPEDIIIDPNILAIATGMSEHDRYALDFLRAIPEILKLCPHTNISAGVSNLSFSFRGNQFIRNAMHAVFLHLAVEAGLTVAIVNMAAAGLYQNLPKTLRGTITDILLCRDTNAAEKLLEIAQKREGGENPPHSSRRGTAASATPPAGGYPPQRPPARTPEELVIYAMLEGDDEHIADDVLALVEKKMSALEIVEGPLMEGMRQVGELFGEGKMFLPQVIRSARVMKKAVAALDPYMNLSAANAQVNLPLIIMATVKGDVHDIGKNIVGTVLACNGFKVLDLGVMVPPETILETAQKQGASFIGLSGLISPSLDEMVYVAREMERQGFSIPLLVGGAAASLAHSALKIAPVYGGPVVYIKDAGQAPGLVRRLSSPVLRPRFLDELAALYEDAVNRHNKIASERRLLSIEAARENRLRLDWNNTVQPEPKISGITGMNDYPLEKLAARFDWDVFMSKWYKPAAGNAEPVFEKIEKDTVLEKDARALLDEIVQKKRLRTRGVLGIFPALSSGDDILVYPVSAKIDFDKPALKIACLRNQTQKAAAAPNVSLADFIRPAATDGASDWIGFFALSAGFGADEIKAGYAAQGDDYRAIISALLADGLVEAFSEEAHSFICREVWGRRDIEGIRPAFGYPCCPDHEDKRAVFKLLEAETRTGLSLTESAMICPAASLCGMYFVNPASYYFSCGAIGGDQLADWARRKNISIETARRRCGFL
ncbi:MAG: methionine synthase [Spirochaetaceae bacterium]|jgi:5-methyltetrahydrofolate--homocysteine methyltransferase|nr:methionine synthase [Spirochaetaceae bacterium]